MSTPSRQAKSVPTRSQRRLAWLFLLLLLFGLTACSGTRLLYQNLDWLTFEAMDDRFEIRPDQEDWVKASLDNLHSWHRVTQLPAYRLTLDELAVRFDDGLDAEDLVWLDRQVERHRRTLVDLVVPELARFLADLDEEQLARYADASQEAIDEAAEQLEWSPRKRQAYRLETFVDRIEPWTGELSEAQLDGLSRDVAGLADIRREWIEQRRSRQREMTELLSRNPGQEEIEAALHARWGDLDSAYPAGYVMQRNRLKQQVFELLVRLDASLTPAQRRHVNQRLEGYVSTIDIVVASR
jgi:hypothetical protein